MSILFSIDYHTGYGEELFLHISEGGEQHGQGSSALRMHTQDGYHWQLDYTPSASKGAVLTYYYSVRKDDKDVRTEWRVVQHQLELSTLYGTTYHVYDHWADIPEDAFLYTSAITDCFVGVKVVSPAESKFAQTVRLKVKAPQLRHGQRLALVGASPSLGSWNTAKALPMTEHSINEWMIDIDALNLRNNFLEFKFVLVDDDNNGRCLWECADNRTITLPLLDLGDVLVYELDTAYFPVSQIKAAGTLIPVFSLRSKSSFGIGDFGDLKKMIDWVALTEQRVLQILPINDTTITHTWTDSYPYSCISIFAIHPQYVDLNQLPSLTEKTDRLRFESLRHELNALPQIDYERVNNAKTEYLQLLFKQEGKTVLASAAFKAFFSEAEGWLVPYAQYCSLREKYGTADFSQWPDHNQWDENDRKALTSPRTNIYKEVAFYYYVQFILFTQMEAAHTYARKHHVVLKGDIPIGVNRYGCDVWTEPHYFNLNGQAGAPPDDFSVNGQNWGFPTYNWDAMLRDNCQWWVRRFQNMAHFFDAYRIDHVLGFFRIWEIPVHAVHGLLGQFQPALGLTIGEIEGYGLHWQEELFTTPFITDWVLDRMFGEKADVVRATYLEKKDDTHYRMRPEFDTQKKVESYFAKITAAKTKNLTPEAAAQAITELNNLRDGLYALISDVLFVRDHKDANKFHPRISVQFDYIYESLYDSDKAVFNRLYNDYFYRRNNQFWYEEAKQKLPKLVNATRMLVCAEDLGMVPDCVAWLMNELRILSLELQSMPKDPQVRFGYPERNPYRSVCTISSHDMPTLRMWWDEDAERTQAFYNTMLHRDGAAPHPLPGWLAREIICNNLTSPSMLCILSIQDWLAIDEQLRLADADAERINIPANPKHYWRYRMHVSIEDLLSNNDFTSNIKELINYSGRK